MIRYLCTAHRRKVITAAAAVTVLVTFAVLGIVLLAGHGPSRAAAPPPAASSVLPTAAAELRRSTVLSAAERAQLDAAPDVAPKFSRLLPPIPAGQRSQPDLYARALFTALFVHPYAGVTRADMLAWVQAEQAASPVVTGGTPAELDRLLVESASDPAWSNHGFAALPDAGTWAQASAGRMSVRLDRLICTTPPEWEQAISAGAITDPGLTERLVSGDLTMTLTRAGRRVSQRVSVALTLLLEGPPTRGRYGAVVIADTNAVGGR